MTLERPLVALTAGLVALAVLVLLDRLRRQPVVVVVASLALFPPSEEASRTAAQARRREWLDLVLKLLAAVALALAAGGPGLPRAGRTGRTARVLVARGASMGAREEPGARIDLARAEVRRALERLAPEDRVDLELAPRTENDPPPGLGRDDALAALVAVRVVGAPHALERRAPVLAAAARERALDPDALPVLVVSDRDARGAFPEELQRAAVFATVGTPRANRAIVGLGSSREGGRERLLVAAANLGDQPAPLRVVLRLSSEERRLDLGTVAPGAIGTAELDDAIVARSPEVEARLEGEDALALDDRVTAVRSSDAPVRIAIVGDLGNPIEKAFEAVPGTVVSKLPTVPVRGYDLVVRRWAEDLEVTEAASVYVAPPEKNRGVAATGFVNGSALAWLAPGTDLARGVVGVTAVRAEVPAGLRHLSGKSMTVLAAGPDGPTLIAASQENKLEVYVGFELPLGAGEGTWAGSVTFPRFWAHVVERARERPEHASELVVHRTGEEMLVPRPAAASPQAALVVEEPPPERRTRGAPLGRFVPLEVGLHRVRAEAEVTDATRFAAGLLDPGASDLRGARARPFTDEELAPFAARASHPEPLALGGAFAALGLLLALAAWWFAEPRASARQRG